MRRRSSAGGGHRPQNAARPGGNMAENDDTRRVFIQGAKQWTDVALRVDGVQPLTNNKPAVDQIK